MSFAAHIHQSLTAFPFRAGTAPNSFPCTGTAFPALRWLFPASAGISQCHHLACPTAEAQSSGLSQPRQAPSLAVFGFLITAVPAAHGVVTRSLSSWLQGGTDQQLGHCHSQPGISIAPGNIAFPVPDREEIHVWLRSLLVALQVTGACRNLTLAVGAHQPGWWLFLAGDSSPVPQLSWCCAGQPRWHLGSKGSFSTNTHFPNSSGVSIHRGVFGQHQDPGPARGQTQ